MRFTLPFKKHQSTAISTPRALNHFLFARFKQMLHTQQLDIFTQVLQFSLVSLEDSLNKEILGTDSYGRKITLFDKTIDRLYHHLVTLNEHLTEQGAWESRPQQSLLLTIFVFYRSLFRDLLAQLSANPIANTQDSYSLIKRLPPQVIYQAGSQYWRLYELFTLIYGDINSLRLNQDLIESLTRVFAEDIEPHDEQACLSKAIRVDNTTLEKADIAMLHQESQQFISWLEASILHEEAGFILGEGDIFIDALHYEPDILFISERVLTRYASQPPKRLLLALQASDALLAKDLEARYALKGKDLPLIGLKINQALGEMVNLHPTIILPLINKTENS